MLDLLLPSVCFLCEAPLGASQVEGGCLGCWTSWTSLGSLRACPRCALPRHEGRMPSRRAGAGPCCADVRSSASGAVAAVLYDEAARRLITRLKRQGRRELLPPMAAMLAAAIRTDAEHDPTAIVTAIPSRTGPDLWRGFSPSGELARGVAQRLGMDASTGLLRRRRWSRTPLKGQSRRRRPVTAARSYAPGTPPPQGRPVLLIDDVMTTGSSFEVCARMLLERGSGPVRGAFWARVPVGEDPPAGRMNP